MYIFITNTENFQQHILYICSNKNKQLLTIFTNTFYYRFFTTFSATHLSSTHINLACATLFHFQRYYRAIFTFRSKHFTPECLRNDTSLSQADFGFQLRLKKHLKLFTQNGRLLSFSLRNVPTWANLISF